jgi:hypothetical protein
MNVSDIITNWQKESFIHLLSHYRNLFKAAALFMYTCRCALSFYGCREMELHADLIKDNLKEGNV